MSPVAHILRLYVLFGFFTKDRQKKRVGLLPLIDASPSFTVTNQNIFGEPSHAMNSPG